MLSEEDRKTILDCASALEASVNAEYRGTLDYPSQKIKYDMDMQPVVEVRAIIDRLTATPPAPQAEGEIEQAKTKIREILEPFMEETERTGGTSYGGMVNALAVEFATLHSAQASGERLPLERLLRERDEFIVSKGLWSEFVTSLRNASAQAPAMPSAPRTYADGIEDAAREAERPRIQDAMIGDISVSADGREIAAAIRDLATKPADKEP